MPKKRGSKAKHKTSSKKVSKTNGNGNHYLKQELTLGQKAADLIAKFGGSWTFIISLIILLILWIVVNTYFLTKASFDPYPYILLNLTLSCLAALQAPIILMAQNRQADRDRIDAKYNYGVNRKAEREVQQIQRSLNYLMKKINNMNKK